MRTKHYRDANGDYIGGYGDGAIPPEGAIESTAPPDARMRWSGGKWNKNQDLIDDEAARQLIKDDWQAIKNDTSIPAPLRRLIRVMLRDMIEGS